MPNDGYIKLYRKMMKWGWYTDTNAKCVFLHLLFLAAYEPCFYRGVQLEPGQAVASIRQIATDTNLTLQSVRTAIDHLKATQEITQQPRGKFSVFTVKNYSDYQCDNTDSNKQTTHKQHSDNTDTDIKKLRNKEIHCAFATFWDAYPRKTNKQKAQQSFEKLNPDEALFAEMLNAIAAQKKSDQWMRDGGKYIPHPTTWLNGKRWEDDTDVKELENGIEYY